MFREQRSSSNARLREVRELLTLIGHLEPQTFKAPDPNELLVLRGLFFVHLYSVLEFAVTSGASRALTLISEQKIICKSIKPPLLALAADSLFSKIKHSSFLKQIEDRLELLDGQHLSKQCTVREEVFGKYLQNIYPETIEIIFSVLCINKKIVPEDRVRGYICELTNNRNSVAHGRESTAYIGSRRRHIELVTILEAIAAFIDYFYDCLSECIETRPYFGGP